MVTYKLLLILQRIKRNRFNKNTNAKAATNSSKPGQLRLFFSLLICAYVNAKKVCSSPRKDRAGWSACHARFCAERGANDILLSAD